LRERAPQPSRRSRLSTLTCPAARRRGKRLSEGGLSELLAQLVDILDRGRIQHSTAGHVAAVV
jgi:hypothetical protein